MSGTGPEAAACVTTQAPAQAYGHSMSGTGPEAAACVTTQAPAQAYGHSMSSSMRAVTGFDREGEGV